MSVKGNTRYVPQNACSSEFSRHSPELVEPIVIQDKPKLVRWILTKKGKDTIPILMSLISFGAKWYSNVVFEDKRARTLHELFPAKRAASP